MQRNNLINDGLENGRYPSDSPPGGPNGWRIVHFEDFQDATYERFQAYYVASLRAYHAVQGAGGFVTKPMWRPAWLASALLAFRRKLVQHGRREGVVGLNLLGRFLLRIPPGLGYASHVGRYVASCGAGRCRFAVDVHDAPGIRSEAIRRDVDVYFKANYWPSRSYPSNVFPIVRGSHYMPENLDLLQRLRSVAKAQDFMFMFKLWAGREHMVRLYEQFRRVRATTLLRAIAVRARGEQGLDEGPDTVYLDWLDRLGVPWDRMGVPQREYWALCASTRAVGVRVGKQLSLPNTVAELLAMGGCIVLDQVPKPAWPVPLKEGINYLSFGLRRPEDTGPAPDEDYARIPSLLEDWLKQEERLAAIRKNNARYFDAHACPYAVGKYIVDTVMGRMM